MSPLPRIPRRPATAHKGDFGSLLLIGGSAAMPGAISLSAMAALRSGAGLVTVATADSVQQVVAGFDPCYMTVGLPSCSTGSIEVDYGTLPQHVGPLEKYDVLAVGPGLSQSPGLAALISDLYQQFSGPLVVDADALNMLALIPGGLPAPAGCRVLTPHPGEFKRLLTHNSAAVFDDRPESLQGLAVEIAGAAEVVLALKGHATFVTDGRQTWCNQTGNPGMASGGSGDVLTGVITALIGQGITPYAATQLGVHLHGAAGDLAADSKGMVSMTARDIVDCLSEAWQQFIQQED